MTDEPNGRRFSWEWIARAFTMVMIGAMVTLLWRVSDTLTEMNNRVTKIEVRLAGNYITRDEARIMMDAMEGRLGQRMDREIPALYGRDPRQ